MTPGARDELPHACDRSTAPASTAAAAAAPRAPRQASAAPSTPRQAPAPAPRNSLYIEDSPDRMQDSPDRGERAQHHEQERRPEERDVPPRSSSPSMEEISQAVYRFNGRPMTIPKALEPVIMARARHHDRGSCATSASCAFAKAVRATT